MTADKTIVSARPGIWTPLLDAAPASRAIETIRAIAGALREPPPASGDTDEDRAISDASLAGGRAGFAILYSYLARAGLTDDVAVAEEFQDEAIAALADVNLPPDLYSGFTGIAWAVSHLADAGASELPDANDQDEIDEALLTYLERSPWTDDYDLVSGLVGLGVYALERLPRRAARDLLALVVDRLDGIAQTGDAGTTWFTPPDLLPDWQRALCPAGHCNLGLAHGVPGVVAVLGGACAAGVRHSKARRLLDGAVPWLLSQGRTDDGGPIFPSWIVAGQASRPGRLAWCYGDPGIAAALLVAARAVGALSWEHEAIEIARHAAACPDRSGVRDAGICHGAAGLAHIFNRLYQATGDARLAEAARFWFTRTLDIRQPDRGIAGYAACYPRANGTIDWKDEPGLLTGAAGIALALLAAVSPIEPAWDRMLLLSLAP